MNDRTGPLRRLSLALAGLLAVASAVFGFTGVNRAHAAGSGFVQRCGTHFCVGSQVSYFAGANSYDLFTFGSGSGDTETQYMDKAAIDAQMADMAADGVTVLRTWMFDHETWHGFEPAKNTMNEQEWAEFDYILYSAAQHGLRVIPTLENYWTAYGGVNTVLGWEGASTSNSGNFFNPSLCAGCLADYEFYVNYALNRVNHYTGVAYKNDPTIFSWELMNEPRYQNETTAENTAGTVFRQWEDTVGAYIKNIDPNHMIDNGIEGQASSYGYGSDNGVPYVHECQSSYIDFCTAHIYPTESWANLSVSATQSLISAYANDAHTTVGKPFFLGEFNTSSSTRSTYWPAIYSTLESTNSDADAFWWYENSAKDGTYGVQHGDAVLSVFTAHSKADKAKSGTGTGTVTVTNPGSQTGTVGTAASLQVHATDSASGTLSYTATGLPAGLAISSATGLISGTPTTAGTFTVTVTAADSTGPSGSAVFTWTVSPAGAGAGCTAAYHVDNQWSYGFTATVTVTNTGSAPTKNWTVSWTWGGNQQVTNMWNANGVQSGATETATNMPYNGVIAAGGTTTFGLQAGFSGANPTPTLTCSIG